MISRADDRIQRRPEPRVTRKPGDDEAPKDPGVDRPQPSNPLLERMKRVDPDQAKKYRQRSGQ